MTDRIVLRPAEAAVALGVSRSKVYELINTKTIPSVRIGCSVRVPVDALRIWIETQVAHSSSTATPDVHDRRANRR